MDWVFKVKKIMERLMSSVYPKEKYRVFSTKENIYINLDWDYIKMRVSKADLLSFNEIEEWIRNELCL